MTHTPTPWQTHDKESTRQSDKWVPVWKDGIVIATCWTEEKNTDAMANAAFIVRAVNSHDALVAALKGARLDLYAQRGFREKEGYPFAYLDDSIAQIDAAIALATDKP